MKRQTKRTVTIAAGLLAAAIISPSMILAAPPTDTGFADPTPRPTPTVGGVLPFGGIDTPRPRPTVVGVNPALTGAVRGIVSTPTLPPTDTE
jgi:hypothetical protein